MSTSTPPGLDGCASPERRCRSWEPRRLSFVGRQRRRTVPCTKRRRKVRATPGCRWHPRRCQPPPWRASARLRRAPGRRPPGSVPGRLATGTARSGGRAAAAAHAVPRRDRRTRRGGAAGQGRLRAVLERAPGSARELHGVPAVRAPLRGRAATPRRRPARGHARRGGAGRLRLRRSRAPRTGRAAREDLGVHDDALAQPAPLRRAGAGPDRRHLARAAPQPFAFFGGVPRRIVLDNLKAGIIRASVTDPEIQRAYRECAEHYGFIVSPCVPHTPSTRAGSSATPSTCGAASSPGAPSARSSRATREAVEWVLEHAGLRVHGTTHEVPLQVFEQRERARSCPSVLNGIAGLVAQAVDGLDELRGLDLRLLEGYDCSRAFKVSIN